MSSETESSWRDIERECAALERYLSNENIISRIKSNDNNFSQIKVLNQTDVISSCDEKEPYYYVTSDNWYELGELNEHIGQTNYLKDIERKLHMHRDADEDGDETTTDNNLRMRLKEAESLCNVLNTIKTVESLRLCVTGGSIFGLLNPFFRQNKNLTELVVNKCKDIGRWEFFISALRDCVSLKSIKISDMEIMGEESGSIFETLRVHQPQLERFEFPGNQLSRRSYEGVCALVGLLRDSKLHTLDISRNAIDCEMYHLAPSMGKLQHLNLSGNSNLSSVGIEALATLLESSVCNLEELLLVDNNIRDGGVQRFATAMTKNRTLKTLDLRGNGITAGWKLFMNPLCDESTINNTYHSNHTLRTLFTREGTFHLETRPPSTIQRHLDLNRIEDKGKVAMLKTLSVHIGEISMTPFLEWDLKCLPIAVKWIDKAILLFQIQDRHYIQSQKLQAVYEFIRGMPAECADGYFNRRNKKAITNRRNKKASRKRARS